MPEQAAICGESTEDLCGVVWCERVAGHASVHCGALEYSADGRTVAALVWGTREQLAEFIGERGPRPDAETVDDRTDCDHDWTPKAFKWRVARPSWPGGEDD